MKQYTEAEADDLVYESFEAKSFNLIIIDTQRQKRITFLMSFYGEYFELKYSMLRPYFLNIERQKLLPSLISFLGEKV